MRRKPLFWLVFSTHAVLACAVSALLLFVGGNWLYDFFLAQTAKDLASTAAMFGEAVRLPIEGKKYGEVDAVADRLGAAAGLRITVVLSDGRVIADSSDVPMPSDNHRTRPEVAKALATGTMSYDVRFSNANHRWLLYVAMPLPHRGEPMGVVRVSTPAAAIEEVLRVSEREILFVALGGLAMMLLASWLIARRISRPLELITEGAVRFARGDFEHRLPVDGAREVARLAQALNEMAAQLREQLETLALDRSLQQSVLSSMEEGVLTLDHRGVILDINRAAEKMFGLDAKKVQGRPIHEVLRKADLLRFFEDTLSSALPRQEDIVIYDKDRKVMTACGNELRDAQNHRIGVLVVIRDVSLPRG